MMLLVDRDPKTLHPSPYNPRRMAKREADNLTRSIKAWGWLENIVVNTRTGHIVSGHMRVQAAIQGGVVSVPVHEIDVDETTERQINLHMNRTRGEWDEQMLAELLAELQQSDADLALTGFDTKEIDNLLSSVGIGEEKAEPNYHERFELIVECPDEPELEALYRQMTEAGKKCRTLIL